MSLEERGYEVRGGVAGTYAVTEDLRHAADVLTRARVLVDQADAAIRRQIALSESVGSATVPNATGAWFAADDALRRVLSSSGGTVAVADDIALQGRQVERAADIYVEAESQVGRELSLLESIGRGVHDIVGTGVWAARAMAAGVLGSLVPPNRLQAMTDSPLADMYFLGHALVEPNAPPPTTGYLNRDGVEMWLGTLDAVGLGEDSFSAYDVVVMQLAMATAVLSALAGPPATGTVVPRVDPRCLATPRGLEDLFTGLHATHSDYDGAVGVQTITQPDGTDAFVVNIPGTQDWDPGTDNSFGGAENPLLMAGQTAASLEHTVAAMRAADIPPDAPVMLAGYSQGGMVAAAIAGSDALRREFNVTHVATAGSPVQPFRRPSGVQYLHVEHREDVTPGLDGGRNPDLPHVTTVTADARSSSDPQVAMNARTLVGTHELSTYADTAALVDAHPSASVEHYLDSASAFVGEGETTSYVEYVSAQVSDASSPPGRAR